MLGVHVCHASSLGLHVSKTRTGNSRKFAIQGASLFWPPILLGLTSHPSHIPVILVDSLSATWSQLLWCGDHRPPRRGSHRCSRTHRTISRQSCIARSGSGRGRRLRQSSGHNQIAEDSHGQRPSSCTVSISVCVRE